MENQFVSLQPVVGKYAGECVGSRIFFFKILSHTILGGLKQKTANQSRGDRSQASQVTVFSFQTHQDGGLQAMPVAHHHDYGSPFLMCAGTNRTASPE